MKRISILLLMIVLLVVGGCSQKEETSNETENDTVAASNEATEGSTESEKSIEEKIDYPTKPIEWILPFNPGGTSDSSARILAKVVTKYLPKKTDIVIIHKPGGGGTIGVDTIFKAKPDGYTIGTATAGPMSFLPLQGTTNYSPDELQPIVKYLNVPRFIITRSDAPYQTFEEWITYLKDNPGEFKLGDAGGAGTPPALAMKKFMDEAGVEFSVIPYNGGGPAASALLGGHVDGIISSPSNFDPNEINVLFTLAGERSSMNKEVPTLKEKGFDISYEEYFGLLAPKDTPKEIISILNDAFKQTLEDPETIEQMKKLGLEISYAGPEDYEKLIKDETANMKDLLKYAE